MRRSLLSRSLAAIYRVINWVTAWHRLPAFVSAINLAPYREALREKNLHSTSPDVIPETPSAPPVPQAEFLMRRTSDGTFNDITDKRLGPRMGSADTRFGRNMPLDRVYPEAELRLLEPSPRVVSCRLLAGRDDRYPFVPATTLNLLAAAWIQFMTHDWFQHSAPRRGREFEVPLDHERGDQWPAGDPMLIRRTPPDPTRIAGANDGPPTYINEGSHWWDGSQVYGNCEAETQALRDLVDPEHRGELLLPDNNLPIDPHSQMQLAGLVDNWWIGLSVIHTLFAREHNAIVQRLRVTYPYWDGDRLFHTARLINVALMAKIHTVEWTPAILGHPALSLAMDANWWGLAGEKIKRLIGRISGSDIVSGIIGSATDHHGVPYALTEEFVAVYRLHPLMPESIRFHRVDDGSFHREWALPDLLAERVGNALEGGLDLEDLCYSFGIAYPGLPVLHNYPRFLRQLERPAPDEPGGKLLIDLAAVDVLRDRERGIPRYNDFRELLRLPRRKTFSDITSNPQWAKELEDVYHDVDRVDLMVGMYAEDFPKGFGFSDTAFRIFILMASRRLQSDRFFTTDYTPEVYTQFGLDWIDANGMVSLILRHLPRVAPALRQVKNAFAPWPRIDASLQAMAGGP